MSSKLDASRGFLLCSICLVAMVGSVIFFWRPGPGSNYSRADVLVLAESLFLMIVMFLNILFYVNRMNRVNAGISRFLPVLFPIALAVWFTSHSPRFDVEINRVIEVLFGFAVASIVINLAGYLYCRQRQTKV